MSRSPARHQRFASQQRMGVRSPADWPRFRMLSIGIQHHMRWETITGDMRSRVIDIMRDTLSARPDGMHLWEATLAGHMDTDQIQFWPLPPVATIHAGLLMDHRDPTLIHRRDTLFAIKGAAQAWRDITGRIRDAVPALSGFRIRLDRHQPGDLPVSRLLATFGREHVMAHVVNRMADGDAAAATVLARMGDERSPS